MTHIFSEGERIRIVSDTGQFDTSESEWLIGEVGWFERYAVDLGADVVYVLIDGCLIPIMAWDIEPAPTPEETGQLPLDFRTS